MSFRDRLLGYLKSCATATGSDLFERRDTPPLACRPAPGEDLAARFATELRAVGGEVFDLAVDGAREDVLRALRELAAEVLEAHRSCVIDEDPAWSSMASVVLDLLREAGWNVETLGTVDSSIASLAERELSATVADLAVAETGSVIQRARSHRARGLSLVPPRHLVVVPRSRLLASFEDALDDPTLALGAGGETFTWITGPSRTADIEKVLTIGVHGPGRWLAILLAEGDARGEVER